MNKVIGLCLIGLEERFGFLMNLVFNSEFIIKYGIVDVIRDIFVFNVDVWLSSIKELVDFGNEKIEGFVSWF